MAFVGISSEYSMAGYTTIENVFISEYIPYSPDHCNKVYLYGLFLALHANADNNLDTMSRTLSLDVEVIQDAYKYWQGEGLVSILSTSPFEVRYLPVKSNLHGKKFSKSKYTDFNDSMSKIITSRMIMPFEWNQYYTTMEQFRIEPSAMVMIAKYCVNIKGENIGHAYINAVARNWAEQDITTVRAVEQHLKDFEHTDSELLEVLKALKIKRAADVEERQLYKKFLDMGFNKDVIVYTAKKCKSGGFSKLNKKLSEYYSARVFDLKEIQAHDKNKEELNALALAVNKLIGVWYGQIENELDTYIVPWTNLGFDQDAITLIADHCFKTNVRTLDGMDNVVQRMFKQGLITVDAISQHLANMSSVDRSISEVLERAGLKRSVNSWDRDSYRTWTYTWSMSHEIVLKAAELASGKAQPIPYMNRVLSEWRNKGVTMENVNQFMSAPSEKTPALKSASNYVREYSDEEWASIVVDLEDLEA